jgi:hypothetical protein
VSRGCSAAWRSGARKWSVALNTVGGRNRLGPARGRAVQPAVVHQPDPTGTKMKIPPAHNPDWGDSPTASLPHERETSGLPGRFMVRRARPHIDFLGQVRRETVPDSGATATLPTVRTNLTLLPAFPARSARPGCFAQVRDGMFRDGSKATGLSVWVSPPCGGLVFSRRDSLSFPGSTVHPGGGRRMTEAVHGHSRKA